MNEGKLIQVIGPVVDVEFADGELPEILTALLISNPAINDTEDNLVVEVAQHLGDNVVRCIAMDVTDGLVRGMQVKNSGKSDYNACRGCRARACPQRGGKACGRVGAGKRHTILSYS